ncbi:hypothetical protein COB52_06000 [Candidatus Kaiserbacteria bacterium]|nr:MAG: hypothetical protein COB52_06000 [Candidatus Kaiserbacteria bacterium]
MFDTQRKLIVVDDDDSFLKIVCHKLKNSHWTVRTFTNGKGVIEDLDGADCIVIDYRLNQENGIELATKIRQTAAADKLPIIIMSAAELSNEDRQEQESLCLKFIKKEVALSNDFSEILDTCCRI